MLAALLLTLSAVLPEGSAPPALEQAWFPDRLHAYVWANWGLVPSDRMAAVVGAPVEGLAEIAERMGLGDEPAISIDQQRRSYITVIRRNWHLLPYDQLLKLLEWSEEEMDFALREDDFLFIKLGSLKPECAPLTYSEPSAAARARGEAIGSAVHQYLPGGVWPGHCRLFDFVRELSSDGEIASLPKDSPDSISPRFGYSYFALYGDPLLDPEMNPYPDGYLARLAATGLDGVWLQGVLFKLAPFPWQPSLSEHHEDRRRNLALLVDRAARQGIKVYLYLNEPRSMPESFFAQREGLRGVTIGGYGMLCTNVPEVREYIAASVETILRDVPGLGGFFTITASENPTNCWSHGQGARCPRCAPIGPGKTIAGVNAAIQEGIDRAGGEARLIAWDWGWADEWAPDAIAALPEKVALQSVSEWSIPIQRGGVDSVIGEYALSIVGPGPRAQRHWELARASGHQTLAKMQVGCTWELGAVPYIPVVANVAEHVAAVARAGVDGIQTGWTLGGYPSPNLEVACALAKDRHLSPDTAMMQVATRRYGDAAAPAVVAAWRAMSDSFKEFPYNIGVVYNAPLQVGPANPLWPEPTGYHATMAGIPYDDLSSWRNVYPPEVFASQLDKVADGFDAALDALSSGAKVEGELAKEIAVGRACALHYRSVAQQTRYLELRKDWIGGDESTRQALRPRLRQVIEQERDTALRLHAIQCNDSRIGFEATNHYFYTPNDLAAKVINCEFLLSGLDADGVPAPEL